MRILLIAALLFSTSLFAQDESLAMVNTSFVNTAYLTPKTVSNVAHIGFWQNPDETFDIQICSSMGAVLMETSSEQVHWSERGFRLPTTQLVPGVYNCRLITEYGGVKVLRFRVQR